MKIFKYREVASGDAVALSRLERIVRQGLLWCARPDTLNDPREFAWTCDFTESPRTVRIVADLLERVKGRPRAVALRMARAVVGSSELANFGGPIVEDTIRKCREEVGVACFGGSADNPVLWARYAGGGSGVCVEIDVPDDLVGKQLHRVDYTDHLVIHIDDFIMAGWDPRYANLHYATLLTKSLYWKPENEIRFLSKRQQIEVAIDRARVTRVYLGPSIEPRIASQVCGLSGDIPVSPLSATA